MATAWDDGSPHSETVWRGYIAQGEYGWNPTARTVEAFKAAHAQREFGFHPNDNHMAFLDELEQEAFSLMMPWSIREGAIRHGELLILL